MKKSFWYYLSVPSSPMLMHSSLCFMRVGIGILTVGHGVPKILGGISLWQSLGQTMGIVGIPFVPVVWGCLAACIEFFGGIALIVGLGTRCASFLLTCMMMLAYSMHLHKGDTFVVYSFALSMVIIFATFTIVGGGTFSLDHIFIYKQKQQSIQ